MSRCFVMAKDKRLWLLSSQIVQSTTIVTAFNIQATLAKVDTSHAVTTLDTIAAVKERLRYKPCTPAMLNRKPSVLSFSVLIRIIHLLMLAVTFIATLAFRRGNHLLAILALPQIFCKRVRLFIHRKIPLSNLCLYLSNLSQVSRLVNT